MLGVIDESITVAWVSGVFLLLSQVATGVFAFLANRRAKEARFEASRAATQTQPSNGVRLATIVEQMDAKIDSVAMDVRDSRAALLRHITDSAIH